MIKSMNKTTMMALLAGALIIPAAAAHAQREPAPAAPTTKNMTVSNAFMMVDTDNSKTIDKAEYDEFAQAQASAGILLSQSFTQLDANKDGTLTIDEFAKQSVKR